MLGAPAAPRAERPAQGQPVTGIRSTIDPHWREAGIFPVIPEGALRATLGILARTVARGYPGGQT